jgi:hypothetical protein
MRQFLRNTGSLGLSKAELDARCKPSGYVLLGVCGAQVVVVAGEGCRVVACFLACLLACWRARSHGGRGHVMS